MGFAWAISDLFVELEGWTGLLMFAVGVGVVVWPRSTRLLP